MTTEVTTRSDAPVADPRFARQRARILDLAADLARAEDLVEASRMLIDTVQELAGAEHGECLWVDATEGSVWSEIEAGREHSVAHGLSGHAVRCGRIVVVDRAREDPRFIARVDAPGADGRERLLLAPIAGADGQVHALLVARRPATEAPFGPVECERLEQFRRFAGPMIDHLASALDAAGAVAEQPQTYRAEALEEHRAGPQHGDVVRITPAWVSRTFWVIVGFTLTAVGFVGLGSVNHYSTGVGVVRAGDRTQVIARYPGTVDQVAVAVGDSVRRGEVVVRLDDDLLEDEARRLDAEYEAAARAHMLDLSDDAAARTVRDVASQRRAVADQLEQRIIRASHDGVVVDIRARTGHAVAPGDVVLTVTTGDGGLELLALLPGDDRPRLSVGKPLRFEIPGYRHEHQWFPIVAIDDAAVGPGEVTRMLGPEVGDSVVPPSPAVLVRAHIPAAHFEADAERYRYHDGMVGTADVRLERQSLFRVLFPFVDEVTR